RLAQPVLEVAPIAEVDGRGIRGEEHECRWRDRGLGHVEQPGPVAADGWRGRSFRGRQQYAIELAGSDALAALAPDVDGGLEDASDALAGLRADRDDRREVEERDVVADPFDVLVERLV